MKYKILPIAGDASFRKFYRFILNNSSKIIVSSKKEKYKNLVAYSAINKFLRKNKILAPKLLAHDYPKGIIVIEDFGDITYTKALRSGFDENKLYSLATDALIRLHKKTQGKKIPQVTHYNLAAFEAEHRLLVDWYYPAVKKKNISMKPFILNYQINTVSQKL